MSYTVHNKPDSGHGFACQQHSALKAPALSHAYCCAEHWCSQHLICHSRCVVLLFHHHSRIAKCGMQQLSATWHLSGIHYLWDCKPWYRLWSPAQHYVRHALSWAYRHVTAGESVQHHCWCATQVSQSFSHKNIDQCFIVLRISSVAVNPCQDAYICCSTSRLSRSCHVVGASTGCHAAKSTAVQYKGCG